MNSEESRVSLFKKSTSDDERILLVIATRIHLGEASRVPEHLEAQVRQFCQMVQDCALHLKDIATIQGAIAVDATRRPTPNEDVDLLAMVQHHCVTQLSSLSDDDPSFPHRRPLVYVIPVQPWGKFVPALNALVAYAARTLQQHASSPSGAILFCSLETVVTPTSVQVLLSHLHFPDTLVCGAVLQGHDYRGPEKDALLSMNDIPSDNSQALRTTLNGLTSPWNTLALWNISKLSLTGFLAVSEGLHDDMTIAGIEEVATISVLQKLHPARMKAKLISVASIEWNTDSFAQDPARKAWHENKMKSKLSRAAKQLKLLQLQNEGVVYHS